MQTLVPSASITAVGFAFANYQEVWNAVDGRLGRYIIESFRKAKLIAFEKMWNNGFRQTTSSTNPIKTPYDVTNQKIRVPAVSLWTSLFESLGAVPTSIPWDETHSALQRKLADGLDSTLAGIYFGKMYEVQKYVSRTNHIWGGFWLLADQRRFEALPAQHQSIIAKNINEAAIKQRADVERLEAELQLELVARACNSTISLILLNLEVNLADRTFTGNGKSILEQMRGRTWKLRPVSWPKELNFRLYAAMARAPAGRYAANPCSHGRAKKPNSLRD